MNDMLVQADEMQTTIDTMNRMIALMEQMSATTHSMVGKIQRHGRRRRRITRPHQPISMTSSDRCAITSTGSRTATTSRCAGRSGRPSTRWTASTP